MYFFFEPRSSTFKCKMQMSRFQYYKKLNFSIQLHILKNQSILFFSTKTLHIPVDGLISSK